MRFKAFIILSLFPIFLFSQGEGANWYFGLNAGLSFKDGQVQPLTNGKITTIEGVATISDQNGNLLFYTDGTEVLDRQHNVMPNGSNLKGNVSSTQSAIIVPKPKNPGIYYLFTVDKPDYTIPKNDPIEGVHYNIIDMSLNSGFGDIVNGQKNLPLQTFNPGSAEESEFKSSEKIAAIIAGDCESYWVVTHFTNKFYSFKVTENGLVTDPVISTVPTNIPPTTRDDGANKTAIGQMKISPDGNLLAIAHASTILGNGPRDTNKTNGKAFLYDFNDDDGTVSNERLVLDTAYPYGVEFSARSEKLYITNNFYKPNGVLDKSELYQFNPNSANVSGTKMLIHTSSFTAGALQLAINGKIYRSGYPFLAEGHNAVSVINKPELTGNAANYVQDAIKLPQGTLVTLGLPQFIQSLLKNDFEFENLCLGDQTDFSISEDANFDSAEWDFGDGSTGTGLEVSHTYTNPGSYTVTVNGYINGIIQEPICKQVDIAENPDVLATYELVQCDIYDNDGSDGLAEFNLQLAKDPITKGNTATQVFFYESRTAAENDVKNSNSLDNVFSNTVRDQKVIAKVTSFGSLCYSISEVSLKTKDGTDIYPDPVSGCDLGNGDAEFNLDLIKTNIVNDYGLPSNISLTFHEREADAALGLNPLPATYLSDPRVLYIRAESDNICYGSGSVELKIGSVPDLQEAFSLQACSSQFPVQIGEDLGINSSRYDFTWNTGETGESITVQQGGTYFLTVSDKELGCSREIEYTVSEQLSPEILDININAELASGQVEIIAEPNGDGFYSLDSESGPFQTSPIFTDVTPGPHTVYVKNENACEVISQEIFVFGFPAFFTPNNDGLNDVWRPFSIKSPEFAIQSIFIFDRYGKLLKQLSPGQGWDGNFNGNPMPSNDYWFEVTLQNGRVFKGHFSLIRSNK
ncbi:T9SS type B sorting domain-containing protein [Christiangramia sp. SM2212]|uniref:T9SS type B sorting domain-containing protein n=1 Tax=Christiangramia sediminicola TaxID=3073267 RepID=A0ABU1ER10_9FLAO|nr:T9SS type B sorting domain-containing protein [Christiangramia sp. SM2212]MDR5590830.1 T9SS type B sorting domain-containing protein [Christiangramia sp. SM2212]